MLASNSVAATSRDVIYATAAQVGSRQGASWSRIRHNGSERTRFQLLRFALFNIQRTRARKLLILRVAVFNFRSFLQ